MFNTILQRIARFTIPYINTNCWRFCLFVEQVEFSYNGVHTIALVRYRFWVWMLWVWSRCLSAPAHLRCKVSTEYNSYNKRYYCDSFRLVNTKPAIIKSQVTTGRKIIPFNYNRFAACLLTQYIGIYMCYE